MASINENPLVSTLGKNFVDNDIFCLVGLPEVNRAVVSIDDSVSPPKYKLLVEGDNFDRVMSTYGVNFRQTKSNNTFEVSFSSFRKFSLT